jgi:hypothetical protein
MTAHRASKVNQAALIPTRREATLSDPEQNVLQPCGRFEWERIVRRCVIHPTTKFVGFVMAQYARSNGTSIRPGTKVVAAVCGMSERNAERHLKTLRSLGLIEKTTGGGGPNRRAASYRLTVPEDLLDRVEMLDPGEGTPDTQMSEVMVENSRHLDVGSSVEIGGELPTSERELPTNDHRTPANDPPLTSNVQTQQPRTTKEHPIRDSRGDVTSARTPDGNSMIRISPQIDLRAYLPRRRDPA